MTASWGAIIAPVIDPSPSPSSARRLRHDALGTVTSDVARLRRDTPGCAHVGPLDKAGGHLESAGGRGHHDEPPGTEASSEATRRLISLRKEGER